ncbi:hypothetical protein LTR84_005890 [Exophiala bonariae]|uniref:1-acyl-sn-glycerol-3-phosphate acyltransferase n=1 Tax=Exophiala bonariae TaxID=1690606 RepID=A0AAV9N291_9EURO|nr:hypothetical protein LTR84_005890 [Exophiala bonariae]
MFFLFRYILYFLSFYTFITMSLFALYSYLPNPPPLIGFIARALSAYLTLIVSAAYGTLASAVLKLLGLHYKYAQWTTGRCFKWLGAITMGIKFDIIDNGREILDSNRPVVIVVNHQTELDVLLLGCVFPLHCSVTAKKSLRNVPFLGWFMTLSGSVFIDRVDRTQAMKAFEGAARAMQDKQQSVAIFPEGTRSYSAEPMLLPFKKGAFHLAVQAGVPIVPVVAENYSRVLNVKAKRFNAGTIRVKVLDPVPTKGLTAADVDSLTRDVREKMLKTITELGKDPESRSISSKKDS